MPELPNSPNPSLPERPPFFLVFDPDADDLPGGIARAKEKRDGEEDPVPPQAA